MRVMSRYNKQVDIVLHAMRDKIGSDMASMAISDEETPATRSLLARERLEDCLQLC
jgi:hypothetical protein